MAQEISLDIKVGSVSEYTRLCPTVTSSSTPVFTWTVPEEISQRRFSLRIVAEEPGKTGYYQSGQVGSQEGIYQFPVGSPMSTNFDGLLSVEIAISESPIWWDSFEYTSGKVYFVFDRIAEDLYNADFATLEWENVVDPDSTQSILYNVVVSQDPTFQNSFLEISDTEVYENELGSKTSDTIDVTPGETYFWRVRAYDGIDFGLWSLTNGFNNHLNYPPMITINEVTPLENVYGDVVINFTTEDLDEEPIYVKAFYTGGSVGTTKTKMSLLTPIILLNNGEHEIIWRSGRDEQQIAADDYVIYLQASDDTGAGPETYYGPFSLDNSAIGGDPGGIGALDIEFPVEGSVVNWLESDYDTGQMPVEGWARVAASGYSEYAPIVTPYITSWQMYAQILLSDDIADYNALDSETNYGHDQSNGEDGPLRFAHGISISPNNTGGGLTFENNNDYSYPGSTSGSESVGLDLAGSEPDFTDTIDYVSDTGFHRKIDDISFGKVHRRYGYIKFKEYALYDKEPCEECEGYGWTVDGLILVASGYYQRTTCPVCNGLRFTGDKLEDNAIRAYSYAVYRPVENWFYPLNQTGLSGFHIETPPVIRKRQFIYGPLVNASSTFPINDDNITETDHQVDAPTIVNGRFIEKGIHPFLNAEGHMAIKVESDYNPPGHDFAVEGAIWYVADDYESALPVTGAIREEAVSYNTGWGPDDGEAYSTRPYGSIYEWEKGIYPITGNIGSIETLESLKIIYLQTGWDAYNTIHWQATASAVSRIHLQVAKFFEDDSHTDYYDVLGEGSTYVPEANSYMIPPNVWHTYWDTVRTQLMDSGYDYKLRIRQFDTVSKTFSQWVYSNKFTIHRNASNPPNIISTRYDPWTRRLYITFRLDDSQKDTYDITNIWYSVDGNTFIPINRSFITGDLSSLSSDEDAVNSDGTQANIHTIAWTTTDFELEPGDEYRIRLEAIPSYIVEGMTSPFFRWYKNDNPVLRKAELEVQNLTGYLALYYEDEDTGEFVEFDTPVHVPGRIDRAQAELDDMMMQPPPSGKWIYFEPVSPSGVLVDAEGYDGWLRTEILPGITRANILSDKADAIAEMRDEDLPYWMGVRDQAERNIRKNLIDQGYYCNGFVNNQQGNGPFRFRVEYMPIGDNAFDGDKYSPTYSTRYEVYHRFQLDFTTSFDSQLNGKPLRDIIYDKNGDMIQGSDKSGNRTTVLTSDGEVDLNQNIYNETWDDTEDTGPWETGNRESDTTFLSGEDTPIDDINYVESGTDFTLYEDALPGERVDYYLNSSYPSVTDTLPSGVSSFETTYHWRTSAFNIITASTREVPRPIITNINHNFSGKLITITYSLYADEDLQAADFYSLEYSVSTKAPAWEHKEPVLFPTDRPVGYEAQDQDNPTVWIPYGLNRSRPCVIVTNTHQYYMWHSKNNCYSQPSIMHARGKDRNVFGEYNQCFTEDTALSLGEYNGSSAIHSPYVVNINGMYHMWATMLKNSTNYIVHMTSIDGSTWSTPTVVSGLLSGSYSPCAYYDGETLHFWFCNATTGTSSIYYATSTDGESFEIKNSSNPVITDTYDVNTPTVVELNSEFFMCYTQYDASSISKIYSASSTDGITWTGNAVAIDTNYSLNPFVLWDVYRGNLALRMYYNILDGTDVLMKTAVLEDRTWAGTGDCSGDKYDVPSSWLGNEKTLTIDLTSWSVSETLRNLSEGQEVKFRLYMTNCDSTKDYYVQSAWLSPENAEDYEAELSPPTFVYNEELKNFNWGDDF